MERTNPNPMSKVTRSPKRRKKDGSFVFPDTKTQFYPNMSPREMIQQGVFGGSYFRDIIDEYGTVHKGKKQIKEFPRAWFRGISVSTWVHSPTYNVSINCYRSKCGTGLKMWHEKKWMRPQDPYGWFQWYCRFFQGRRDAEEDERQIRRALAIMGPKGRWRNRLIHLCERKKLDVRDPRHYPVLRQILLHWAYRVPKESKRLLRVLQNDFQINPPRNIHLDPYTMKYVK